jgi:hypothetical protein
MDNPNEIPKLAVLRGQKFTFITSIFFALLLFDLLTAREGVLSSVTVDHALMKLFGLQPTWPVIRAIGLMFLINVFLFVVATVWRWVRFPNA